MEKKFETMLQDIRFSKNVKHPEALMLWCDLKWCDGQCSCASLVEVPENGDGWGDGRVYGTRTYTRDEFAADVLA